MVSAVAPVRHIAVIELGEQPVVTSLANQGIAQVSYGDSVIEAKWNFAIALLSDLYFKLEDAVQIPSEAQQSGALEQKLKEANAIHVSSVRLSRAIPAIWVDFQNILQKRALAALPDYELNFYVLGEAR